MAQETNQTQVPMLCTLGCGFYGNPRTNGMCSVCYKVHMARQQGGGRSSPPGGEKASTSVGSSETSINVESTTSEPATQMTVSSAEEPASSPCSPRPVTQQMTEMSISPEAVVVDADPAQEEDAGPSTCTEPVAEAAQANSDGDKTPDKNKKKNRCFSCRKKVGLTGFDCRCGNLFCSIHRYSDKHNCTFDYRGEATERLRKDNPLVMAEKIQKL